MTVNLIFTPYNHNGIYPLQLAKNREVVHVTGNETIDGTKIFLKDIRQETNTSTAFQGVTCKNYGFDFTQTTLNNERGARVISLDKNGDYFGAFQTTADSSKNYIQSCMFARRKVNGKDSTSSIWVGVDNSGNIASYAPYCDKINSIVNTAGISKAANGYVKFGNGLIIQWGIRTSQNSQNYSVTLPTAFSTTNYTPIIIDTTDGSGNSHCSITSVTKTSFSGKHSSDGTTMRWIAVGY